MARAKRTDRAEARRRYRAAMAEAGTPVSDLDPDDEDAPAKPAGVPRLDHRSRRRLRAPPARPRCSAPASPTPSGPPSARLDLRGDLKALPGLMKHPAFWGPLLLSAAAVAAIPIFGADRR